MKIFKGIKYGILFSLIMWVMLLFMFGCGEDESQITEQIPPIPPVYRNDPVPTVPNQPDRHDHVKKIQITPDQCLADARRQYPHITIREGHAQNAKTEFFGYGRIVVTMGYHLRRTIDAEQFCAILSHELGHAVRNSRSEIIADYYSMIYLRQMLMNRRYRHDDRKLDRIAQKQFRWLSRMPRSPRHPHPKKRLRIMRKAIQRKKLNRSDYY